MRRILVGLLFTAVILAAILAPGDLLGPFAVLAGLEDLSCGVNYEDPSAYEARRDIRNYMDSAIMPVPLPSLEEAISWASPQWAALNSSLARPDQFLWESGRPASGNNPDFDVRSLKVQLAGPSLQFEYQMSAPPRRFPMFFKAAVNLPCGGRCRSWLRPAFAQGQQNPFGGPGFQEDFVLFARLDGPGRVTMAVLVGTTERPLRASASVDGRQIRLSIPMTSANDLGLLRPGARFVFGIVGPPPESVYDRVPERGALQLGIPSFSLQPAMIKARFDVTGDGKDDLYYLDTNGNGLIDAAAHDRNGDGQIVFAHGDGPGQLLTTGSAPAEFPEVHRVAAGKKQVFALVNSALLYLTIVEDKNGDGDIKDAGELEAIYVPRQ